MSARVLVADDIAANRKLLQTKLTHEYYQVSLAENGREAIDVAKSTQPDIILLDVMMPVMDGFEACEILKTDPDTQHIPVVMVTALGDREHRLKGLTAGADDFLTKPVDDFALLSRVRALTKYKMIVDELRLREASGRRIGVIENQDFGFYDESAQVLIVDDNERQARRIALSLKEKHRPILFQDSGLKMSGEIPVDILVLSLDAKRFDPLRMCAHFKSSPHTKDLPLLAIADMDDEPKAMRALELGASDVIMRPIDTEELVARVQTQVRKKRYVEAMRRRLDEGMEMAITDQLTGLYNRRHMVNKLDQHLLRAHGGDGPLSLFIADIDHFKSVNDTYGHDVGDEVLREFARRIQNTTRPSDIACRQGGEEFIVIMPNTPGDKAQAAAERVRRQVCAEPFTVNGGKDQLSVTVSLGVSTTNEPGETADDLIKRADLALYNAKETGRNRVVSQAA